MADPTIREPMAQPVPARAVACRQGLYTPAQIASWRKLTAAVHAKGGRLFVQFWYVGCHEQAAETAAQARFTDECRTAAAQAVDAGFDGVELHIGNAGLLEAVEAVAMEIGAERIRVIDALTAQYSFIVGRLGVAYHRVPQDALPCPTEEPPLDRRRAA